MTESDRAAFDFSRDAQGFKARLWNKLKANIPARDICQLEDDDLAFVNAAGVPQPKPQDERLY